VRYQSYYQNKPKYTVDLHAEGQTNKNEFLFPEREDRGRTNETEYNSAPDFTGRGYCVDRDGQKDPGKPDQLIRKSNNKELKWTV
jgi:hypothetical protein